MIRQNRHSVRMRDDSLGPVSVMRAELSDAPNHAGLGAVVLLDHGTDTDPYVVSGESDRLPDLTDGYRDALAGLEAEFHTKARDRSTSVGQVKMQMWGGGTSGVPRKGSRTIHLFHAGPNELVEAIRLVDATGRLRLTRYEHRVVAAEPVLRITGHLYGSFRFLPSVPVEVSMRVARFNERFAAVELKLEAKRHPRRFFRAAHDAIDALDLPGRYLRQ